MFPVASTATTSVSGTVTITTNTIIRPIITILVIIRGIPSYTSPILSKRTLLGERGGPACMQMNLASNPVINPAGCPAIRDLSLFYQPLGSIPKE